MLGEGGGDNDAESLISILLGCGSVPGVAIKELGRVLGGIPSGAGMRDEADLCCGGDGSVVHSRCIDGS